MPSQTGQRIITVHILPNISRRKDNHAMKFRQSLEFIVRNNFLQILYRKWGGETSPTPLFVIKRPGPIFPPHFMYDFSRKIFLMLYSVNWLNFFVCLSLLLEILDNICIEIICSPVCDVTYFETDLRFLIKPFFYITKKSAQSIKYPKNEMTF